MAGGKMAARLFAALATLALVLQVAVAPARAAGLLRDADIEHALREVGAPVLRELGLSPAQIRILVVNDARLNAFVVDHEHIFINHGLLLKIDSAPELQAIIAHEGAHVANGHISRRLGNLRSARTAAGLGLLLALATAAVGGGAAAPGIAIGTASSAQRVFFSHTRAEETSADRAGLAAMLRAGVDPKGALDVMEIFAGQEYVSEARQDPYVRTHPLSRDRLRALRAQAEAAATAPRPDRSAEYWFARARAKLSAFKRAPSWTLRRLDDSPTDDIRYMRAAIAWHRSAAPDKAIAFIDKALALRPDDPYLLDLKGQILLESRRPKDAVRAWRRAAGLAPREALILGGYGRALIAAREYGAALRVLERARAADFGDPRILRDLAVAYARQNRPAMASLVTAERYALMGRFKDAELHARRALRRLPAGSGARRRAEDVLATIALAKRRH